MKQVLLRVDGFVERELERLVKEGFFVTRSEALRAGLLSIAKEYRAIDFGDGDKLIQLPPNHPAVLKMRQMALKTDKEKGWIPWAQVKHDRELIDSGKAVFENGVLRRVGPARVGTVSVVRQKRQRSGRKKS